MGVPLFLLDNKAGNRLDLTPRLTLTFLEILQHHLHTWLHVALRAAVQIFAHQQHIFLQIKSYTHHQIKKEATKNK